MEPDEQAQSLAVIDVESEAIDNCVEPEKLEETEQWYSALQIQGLLRVSKAGLLQGATIAPEPLQGSVFALQTHFINVGLLTKESQ